MKKNTIKLTCLLLVLVLSKLNAQMTGAYTVPGSYASIGLAIADLNTLGVSGAVTINIAAGHTETASVGGYTLNSITGASATNSIVIQKNGAGANPIVYAYAGGVGTPATAVQDGVIRFVGTDFVTIDGIDITDPNTANPATMEFGYGFFRASVTNGCQNNTIKNCVITLNRINNVGGSGPAIDGSRGIDVVNATTAAHTTALTITNATGANSNNKFYSNTIQNCNYGISLIGFADSTPFALADVGNDIGGSSSATGNTIINFGGGGTTSAAAGIRTLAQYGINVSYNVINNNNGSGVNHAEVLRGIYLNTATSAISTINNNTVTLKGAGTTQAVNAIHNVAGSTAASNTITIANNLVTNCTYTTATSGSFNGILNAGNGTRVHIYNNMVSNSLLYGTGALTGINGGGATGSLVDIMTNTVTLNVHAGASGSFYCMRATTASVTAIGNLITNNSYTNTSGTTACELFGYYNLGSPTYEFLTNNIISNLSIGGNNSGTSNVLYGFYSNTIASATKTISGNTIYALSSVATVTTANVYGIIQALGSSNIFKNRIYDLTAGGIGSSCSGIFVASGAVVSVYNNLISDLKTPSSNLSLALNALVFNGGTTMNAYYNTVLLNATSTGTAFGSSAIFASTTPNLTLRNNIFVNLSTSTGTGVTASYRRGGTTVSSYSVGSNNNLFYAGTPGASNLIYTDGTNTSQTLAAYKTLMAIRDGVSITENPTFVSTVGNNANFLNINAVTPTQIESGGWPIAGFSDDYAGTVRNATMPDIGAWEGAFVLSDVSGPSMNSSGFTTPGCLPAGRTFTASFSDVSGVASGALAPRIYYKINAGAYTSVSGTLTSGTVNNGVWTFNMTYAGATSDIVSYFVVAQDLLGGANIASYPSAGFAGTDVNTITSFPTAPNTYGINALNGVYTVGASGTFTSLTAASNAYNTYCLTGPVTFSLTDALYSTAETFPIVFQNNGDASATNSLLIIPAVGVGVVITPTAATLPAVIKFRDARYITMDGLNTAGSSITLNNSTASAAVANIWMASATTGNKFIGVKNLLVNGTSTTTSNGIIACIDGVNPSTTGGADNDNITVTSNTFLTVYNGVLGFGTASVSAGGLDNWLISNNRLGPITSGTNNIGGNGMGLTGIVNFSITGNAIRNFVGSGTGINVANASTLSAMSNTIESFSTSGNGIYLGTSTSCTLTSNLVQNFTLTASAVHGINITSSVTAFVVSQNTVTNLNNSGTTTSAANVASAMYLGSGVNTGTINANVISTVFNSSTSGYGVRGMFVATGIAASNLNIRNNFVADVYCYCDAAVQYWATAIALEGATGGLNIDNNTVNQSRTFAGYNGATGSAALYINATGGNIAVRNNILANTYNNTTVTTDINYGIYSGVANTNFTTINYNNYYVGGTGNNPVLGYLTANQANIAAIQTAFGGNVNSTNIQPVFVSSTDLHMQPISANITLDNTGTPLAGITTDIDNQARSLTTPDMGADEFTVPTCTNALGGTIAPTTTVVCAGQTLTAVSTGVSTGLNTVYQWEVGASGTGPFGNITGGSGGSTPSYTSDPLAAGVYYVRLKTTCTTMTAASNVVTVTVNAPPTVTASAASTVICEGQSVNLTGLGSGTTYTWTGPYSYSTTTQNPVFASASPTVSGSYSLASTSGGCTSTMSTIFIAVRRNPQTLTLSPASASICAGGSQTLTALGGVTNPTLNWGTQANQNGASTTASGYPAPYSLYYGGQRMQILIYASELYAAGFVAGSPITSVQFPVVSKGANWGVGVTENQNFQVNIGNSNLTNLTAFQGGLSNVVAPANFTPVVGYSNTHTFASPYVWNGTSNIILETTFSNNYSGVAGDVVVQYNSPTSFQSTIVYRNDSQTAAVVASNTTISYGYSARPDLRLNGTAIGTMSWTPSAGLSGTTGSTVVASPAASTNYTITASIGSCSTNTNMAISIIAVPVVSITATPTAVCAGDATTLTASGATTYSWNPTNLTNTISVTPVGTTVYTVTAQNGNCTAVTETISVTANALPPVQASANPTLVCAGQSATLTGSGATTYAWVTGPSTNTYVVSPTSGTTYTVTGTDANGCSDDAVVTVASGTTPVVGALPATQSVCASSPATFTASGAATYSWSSGSTNTVLTINSAATAVYTVTGFASTGCSATQTVSLTAWALPVLTVSPASPTICNMESVLLTASGASNYSWMPGSTGTTTLSVNPATTTSYSVEGTDANGCKDTKIVVVTVDPCTGLKETTLSGKTMLYPNPSTGLITAEFGYDGTKNIVVLNSVGAVIMSSTTEEQSVSLDLSVFAKGVYFVNVRSNGTSANYKVVIQ